MAILCRQHHHHSEMVMCAECLHKPKLPHQLRRTSCSVFDPAHHSIKVTALVGAGRMSAEGDDEREEARLFYVRATRAAQCLEIGLSGGGPFAAMLVA